MSLARLLLFPVSLTYGLVTWARNRFFDIGILPSRSFNFPIIGIGNLSSGGSGKTPMIEYLVSLLKETHRVAVLGRGYKRKSIGFRVGDDKSTVLDVGDEALQVYGKNPDIVVAVNCNRVRGVEKILARFPETNLVLLDDSFQHRYIKPGLNLLLTHYNRMFYDDFLIPAGQLREFRSGVKRASAMVVTNTPQIFSPLEKKLVLDNIRRYFGGKVFFSTIDYGDFVPLGSHGKCFPKRPKTIFLFSGIASTVALENHLRKICDNLIVKQFPDHYNFKGKDLLSLKSDFHDTLGHSKIMVVTEKDAMRLQDFNLLNILKGMPVFYLPIKVRFQGTDAVLFNKFLFQYLQEARSL